jgi:hypothetical protein
MFFENLPNERKDSVSTNPAPQRLPFESPRIGAVNGSNTCAIMPLKFQSPFGACNFIVTWDGEDVRELLAAINCARQSGDRFIQDKLIEYILNIPYRNPRPADIPAFIGKPVWAVDKHGRALVGMPGTEAIIESSTLKEQLKHSNGEQLKNSNGHVTKDESLTLPRVIRNG